MPSRGQQLGRLLNPTGDIVETSLPPKIETFSQSVSNTGKIEKAALGNDVSTIEQVSDVSLLAASGNTVGDQRVVGNNLYIWNGSGWFRIALINETPTWDSGGQPAGAYVLDADSPQTATSITLAATDPDGFPISYSYVTGGSMDSIATISQDSSVFTITPKTEVQAPDGGTGTITFRASDGVNILPAVSSFTLSFSVDWSSSTQQAMIKASDAFTGDYFGYSVSLSNDGNTAIVGAIYEDPGSPNSNAGSAYIFTRSGSTWSQEAKIEASDAQADDNFGYSVSLSNDGNTAIVGAYLEDTGGTGVGAAYIFTRSGTSWSQQAKIQASDPAQYDYFGWSVSISSDGDTAIIGSIYEETGGANTGAAYIFTRSGSTWSQEAKIEAADKQSHDNFGCSVSISSDGDTAIIGAWGSYYTPDGANNAGSAYIFTRSGTSWSQQAKMQASDAAFDDRFGSVVSISSDGNTAIIGAMYEDTSGSNAGSAYIFTRSGSTWSQEAKIQASDKQSGDNFGHSVSISNDGNTAIVGAIYEDTTASDAGSAYIFTRSGTSWSQQAKIQASNANGSDYFGGSVSISNDGNTAIVGAYQQTGNEGAAYIFIPG
jgi:hypothetical protein